MTNQIRKIWVPGLEKWISLKAYLAGIRLAKANLNVEFKYGITCWWPCTGREIMHQFFQGVQDRINEAIPYMDHGSDRKTI